MKRRLARFILGLMIGYYRHRRKVKAKRIVRTNLEGYRYGG